MKTDSLFYELFRRLPTLPFELLGEDPGQAGEYRFDSLEIKQTAFRIDSVLLPRRDVAGRWIHFLEVQFQKDRDVYRTLFAEIFLYLKQKKPKSNWRAAVYFARRSLDPGLSAHYEMLRSHLNIVYLDNLKSTSELTPGLDLVRMIVAPEKQTTQVVRQLRRKIDEEPGKRGVSREIMELMETILLYKFPKMSREEIEMLYRLKDIEGSVVYQEALAKGKLEAVPLLVQSGWTVEGIAQELGLDIEAVRQAAAKSPKRKRTVNGTRRETS